MATITTNGSGGGNWHVTTTWSGGVVPATSDRVVVQQGDTLTIDGVCKCTGSTHSTSNSAANAALENHGTLTVSTAITSELWTYGQIWNSPLVSGDQCTINFGTEAAPITGSFIWYLNPGGSNVNGYVNGLYSYYSSSRYPTFTMVSSIERKRNTWLVGEVSAGDTTLVVDDASNWSVGDKLWLTPRYTVAHNARALYESEEVQISAISGTTITISSGLSYDHGYADSDDYKAGGVANMTSNVQVIGGADRPMYRQYHRRGNVVYKNVAFQYANNRYNYVSSIVTVHEGNIYGRDAIVENCAFVIDTTLSLHMREVLYFYSTYTENTRVLNQGNAVIAKAQSGGYNFYGSYVNYYTGRNAQLEDCCVYAGGTRYLTTAFSCYQQPVTYTDCRAYGVHYGFVLHNNVDADTSNCWAVGAYYGFYTYNGTAIHKDIRFRYVDYPGYLTSNWRGKVQVLRSDFDNAHSYASSENYVRRASPLPDGNEYLLLDVQNDPTRQEGYYTFGTTKRDTTIYASSVASIKFIPIDASNALVFTTSKFINSGLTLTVTVKARKNAAYNGTARPLIRLTCSQFDVTQEMTNVDDTWTDVSITSSTLTADEMVEIRIEVIGTAGAGWFDDLTIDNSVFDIGTQMFFGGTEISNVVDITDTTVPVEVTVKDQSGTEIQGARVLLLQTSDDSVVLSGVTDVNGELTTRVEYTTDVDVYGRVRMASSSPYYKTSDLAGTITSSGYLITVTLLGDE